MNTPDQHADTLAQPLAAVSTPSAWLHDSAAHFFHDAAVVASRHLTGPYTSLLVHTGSMTERLEQRFGTPMTIKVLCKDVRGDRYARWVVMLDPTRRCIAMAGVCLALDALGEDLRAAVLQGQQPLGRLLARHGIAYRSVPTAFLRFTPTTFTKNLLQMGEAQPIFGRCTALRAGVEALGDIIEALPRYELQYGLGRAARPVSSCVNGARDVRDDGLGDSHLR